MKELFPPFLENIRRHGLVAPGDTVVAGFSGGKDSTVMLLLFQELQKEIPFDLVAAYFNHGLRADVAQEEEWVKDFCRERRIEMISGGRDVLRFKDEGGLNLEHAASLSRYDFFRRVAGDYPNAKIATAHTRSDLAETFFIKLFRGSGLQGLSAIYERKEETIIRPLLLFSTAEIESFLSRNRIPWYHDRTNEDDAFLRNRIRRRLMPAAREIEPVVEERIFRTVMLLQDEYEFYSRQARSILNRFLVLGTILPVRAFQDLHPALQRHVAREYIRRLKGNLQHIGLENIEEILRSGNSLRGLSIPGIDLRREKGFLFPAGIRIPGVVRLIERTGAYALPEIGLALHIRRVQRFVKPQDNNRIVVPAATIAFPLTLRPARKTDAYRKIHAAYRQNVFEMIRSSGTPHRLRNLCPVLVNGDGRLIWVRGSPLADEFKLDPKPSASCLRFKFLPLPPGNGDFSAREGNSIFKNGAKPKTK